MQKLLSCFVFMGVAKLFLLSSFAIAETTNSSENGPVEITISGPLQPNFDFGFNPIRPHFATGDRIAGFDTMTDSEKLRSMTNLARCYADPMWNSFTYADQAGFIADTYGALIATHRSGLPESDGSYSFTPRVLTCKAFKESTFNTQMGNAQGSSGVGLTQPLDDTLDWVFNGGLQFRSVVPGYETISDGPTMKRAMAANPTLQLEMGLAIMELKRRESHTSGDNVKPILKRYLGSSDAANEAYAQSIYDCAVCVRQNNGMFSLKCLCKTKPDDKGCTNVERAQPPTGCTP